MHEDHTIIGLATLLSLVLLSYVATIVSRPPPAPSESTMPFDHYDSK